MNISLPFISRPVATTLITVAIVLAGAVAFRLLPVSALPPVDYPTINVSASLPGADPETMATSVAAPLERQFGRIAGVTEMTSTSYRGSTSIVLQFDLNRNINGAARDVQAAINAARGFLPQNLPAPPRYWKWNPADAPVLAVALQSDTLTSAQLYDAASSVIGQKLSQVDGVGQVFVGGASLPAVRVELNPTALNKYSVSIEDVRGVLNRTTTLRPKGRITNHDRSWEIDTNGQLNSAVEFAPLIVAYRSGAAVRLADVGGVVDSVENLRNMGLVNGKPAVMVNIYREPSANIIDTVDRIKHLFPQLIASLPGSIDYTVIQDRTPPIRGSLRDVEISLLISFALVILVVFAFLRNVRSTIIPAVAVAGSLIGTFGVMYLCGYNLDNLSLMALTIATGFVVDDAIVVLENSTRHMEAGMSPMEAAIKGSNEIGFTVLSMSVSLIAVFIPILLMGGMVGRLFREFAVTLSTAIAMSLVLSLTTTPMMCARILRPGKGRAHGHIYALSENAFDGMRRCYDTTLRWALRHPKLMLLTVLVTVATTVYLFAVIPKGFFPEQDTGRIGATIIADQDISFQSMKEKVTRIIGIVSKDPDVEYVGGFTGGSGGGGTPANIGRMMISLKPFGQRKGSSAEFIARLRGKLSSVPGALTVMQPVQDIRIGGRMASAMYQYTLEGDNLADLVAWAPRVLQRLRTLPGLVDLSSDQQNKGLEARLAIDRDTASRLGITPRMIDNVLYDAFGQRQVAIRYTQMNQYRVIMEVAPEYWQRPETLNDIHVRSATSGAMVPLSAFTHFERTATSLAVAHHGQFPAVTISFNLAPGKSLGNAVEEIAEATRQMGIPASIKGNFAGTAQAFQASLANQPVLILAALLTVYIVLGILYESFVHPITILSTLPSAGVGALLALIISHSDLTVIAIIGILLLIGIVKKNGIMMVDFAIAAERKEGKAPADAIYEACLLRFRPIMMTTMAALLGALPLALGHGIGSELRRPLGISIAGGLVLSQLLTLYTTPVMYLMLDRFRLRVKGLWRGTHQGRMDEAVREGIGT
jgi:hydrophobe/amphiphile efflux-1 (HAE1) family protein